MGAFLLLVLRPSLCILAKFKSQKKLLYSYCFNGLWRSAFSHSIFHPQGPWPHYKNECPHTPSACNPIGAISVSNHPVRVYFISNGGALFFTISILLKFLFGGLWVNNRSRLYDIFKCMFTNGGWMVDFRVCGGRGIERVYVLQKDVSLQKRLQGYKITKIRPDTKQTPPP